MRADNAQRVPVEDQIGQHRTARFERGQRNNFAMPHFNPATDEKGIAVPADALRTPANLDRLICPLFEQQMVRNGAHPVAKAPVCLLQRDNISVYFVQDCKDAFGIAPPIGAHTFVDVIGRDLDRWHGQSAGPK